MNQIATNRLMRRLANVEHLFSKEVAAFRSRLEDLDARIDPRAEPQWEDLFHRQLREAFQESQDACRRFEEQNGDDPIVIRDVQDGFRQETAAWFERSWIGHRARSKPSGFAGDFEMLIKLYEQATPARGLGGYLDLCIMELPLAQAVRARCQAVREFLLREVGARQEVRILDIACGPCREYLDWPGELTQPVEIVAMDNDSQALAYLETQVGPSLPPQFALRPTRYNALRTRSAETTERKFGRFDIIYSVGLWDYLPDEPLIAMLTALPATLRDGGVLYIAFKDCERYDKTPYQWHLDWHFFQRTEADCRRLYERAGIELDAVTTTRDATGIILNFIHRPEGAAIRRTHGAENVLAGRHGGAARALPSVQEE